MQYTLVDLKTLPRITVAIASNDPLVPPLTVQRMRDIIFACQVRARGWYFPHISSENLVSGPKSAYISHETEAQGWIDHLERWRLYASGQFVFEEMLWEVPNAELQDQMRKQARLYDTGKKSVDGFISFIGIIYYVSEIFMFAANLAQTVPYKAAVIIDIGLRGIENWALGSSDFGVDIQPYTARSSHLQSESAYPVSQLISEPLDLAREAIIEIFNQFGFLNPEQRMIARWQSNIFTMQRQA